MVRGILNSIDNYPAGKYRLTKFATKRKVNGLSHPEHLKTVDYTTDFDGKEMVPTALTSVLPLVLNGSAGIAVVTFWKHVYFSICCADCRCVAKRLLVLSIAVSEQSMPVGLALEQGDV